MSRSICMDTQCQHLSIQQYKQVRIDNTYMNLRLVFNFSLELNKNPPTSNNFSPLYQLNQYFLLIKQFKPHYSWIFISKRSNHIQYLSEVKLHLELKILPFIYLVIFWPSSAQAPVPLYIYQIFVADDPQCYTAYFELFFANFQLPYIAGMCAYFLLVVKHMITFLWQMNIC